MTYWLTQLMKGHNEYSTFFVPDYLRFVSLVSFCHVTGVLEVKDSIDHTLVHRKAFDAEQVHLSTR